MIQFPSTNLWFSFVIGLNIVVWGLSILLVVRKFNFNANEVIGFLFIFNLLLLVTSISRSEYSNSGHWFWLTVLVILTSNILALALRGKLNGK